MCRMINNKLKYKHYCSIVESSTFCFHYLHGCCSFDMAIYAWGQIPVHFLLQPLSSWKHRVQPHNCAISAVNSKVAIFFTRPTYRTRCAVTFIFLLLAIFGLKAFWRKWLRICPTHKQKAELVHLMDWVIQAIAGSLLQKTHGVITMQECNVWLHILVSVISLVSRSMMRSSWTDESTGSMKKFAAVICLLLATCTKTQIIIIVYLLSKMYLSIRWG